jgi:AcrR family transcriptional regulator
MPKLKYSHVREKIINTANDLFFNQGYHQTGINQIIEEAGVAKATFYAHFKSKEDLGVEYMRVSAAHSSKAIKDMVNSIDDPVEKYISIIESLVRYMKDTDFRGCAFSNIASEIVDKNNPMRKEVKFHEDMFRSIIKDVVSNLKESEQRYSNIDVEPVANLYYVIVEGALTASRNYQDLWPMDCAIAAIKDLIK